MSGIRLTQAESDRLVNRLKNTNLEKFHTLCKMHLSFLLHLPGNSLEEFLSGGGATCLTAPVLTATPGAMATPASEKSRLHFRSFSKKKSKDVKSPHSPLSLTQETIDQLLPLLEFLGQEDNLCQEGLFRKNGHIGRQKLLREKLTAGEDVRLDLEKAVYSAHDCANVLKTTLSDLPEPLMTDKLYPAYCQLALMEPGKQLQTVQLLLQLLPAENLFLLRAVLSLLNKVCSEPRTKMTPETLGTLFVPHLLVPRHTSPHDLHTVVPVLTKVISTTITHADDLFTVPAALVRDIATYWSEMEACGPEDPSPDQLFERRLSYRKRARDEPPISTAVTFADRAASQRAAENTDTQVALAQLYAHVHAMPESAKKRKLVKHFNKAKGVGNSPAVGTPTTGGRHKRSRSFGDSIKKMVGRNHKRAGSSHKLQFDTALTIAPTTEHLSYKPRPPIVTATPVTKFHSRQQQIAAAKSRKLPREQRPHIVDMKENADPCTPRRKPRQFCLPESPTYTPCKGSDKENAYMSPITKSVSKAPLSIQASIMTPGSRAAVAMLLTP